MQTLFRLSLTSLLVWSISCGSDESATNQPGPADNPNANNAPGTANPPGPNGSENNGNPANPTHTTEPPHTEAGAAPSAEDAQLADIKAQMDDPNRPDALKPLALPDADGNDGIAEADAEPSEDASANGSLNSECAVHLKEIQEAQNSSGYEPAPIHNWTPDDNPTSTARSWAPPMEFEDTWSTAEPIFGSYKVTVTGDQYTAYCKEDLDGDGTPATWEIARSGEPKKTSPESTH